MGTVIIGVKEFFRLWNLLASKLIEEEGNKTPEGSSRLGEAKDILEASTALEFVTWAQRSRDKGVFIRASYVSDSLKAELLPLNETPESISNAARQRAYNRLNAAASRTMKTLMHFKLFEAVGARVYRLTEKGNEYYDILDKADI